MTELLFSFPTAAIQTFATFRTDTGEAQDDRKPFQLDRCHALDTGAKRCAATIRAGIAPMASQKPNKPGEEAQNHAVV